MTVEVDSALGEAVSVTMESSYTMTVEADLVLGKSNSTESVAEESESAATEAIHERASQPCPGRRADLARLRRRGFSYLGSQARASLPDKPAKRRTTKRLALPGEASRAANKGSKHALYYIFFASQ